MTSRRSHSAILWNAPGGFLPKMAREKSQIMEGIEIL